jgi:UTP-glucose-1-phosphate uridylyltransferase
MEFISQELSNVPENSTYNVNREKPWGTAHAIWVARNVINEPFGVINADDYYGVDSFCQLADFLTESHKNNTEITLLWPIICAIHFRIMVLSIAEFAIWIQLREI